jgi:6-pyruvoyltetrahydropterin/6-carboxytetrahydropterin synthase
MTKAEKGWADANVKAEKGSVPVRIAAIELEKEEMKFSAGHFTIFSATERENLHGHNFTVSVTLHAPVGEDGLIGDYRAMKQRLFGLCRSLNETLLLPTRSPYLTIGEEAGRVLAHFNGETMTFMSRDVTLLPVANVSVEELSRHLGERLLESGAFGSRCVELQVKVASGPGQYGIWRWAAK